MITNALEVPITQQDVRPLLPDFRWFEITSDPEGWGRIIENQTLGMFHTGPLLRAHADGRAQPIGILLPQPDGSTLPIGGLITPMGSHRSFKTLAFPPLAATEDPELVKTLTTWLFAQGVKKIEFGSFTCGVEGYSLPTVETALRLRQEFIWSLEISPEERFRALRSNHRRKLRKLRQEPLELRRLERFQAERMAQLRVQWGQRRALSFSMLEMVQMYMYYRRLHRHLTRAGVGHLYGLYDQEGGLLSLAYMLEVGEMAFYMIGASSPAGYRLNASLRLFWDLAKQYQSQGYRYLHFGGVPAAATSKQHEEHGVFRFKAGFGIEPISRTTLLIQQ